MYTKKEIKGLVPKVLFNLAIEGTLKRASGWHFWGILFFRKMNHLPDILNRVSLRVWRGIQTYIVLGNKCLMWRWNTGLLRHFVVLDFGGSDYFVRIKRHYSFTNFQPLLTKFNAVLPRTCLLRSTLAKIRSSQRRYWWKFSEFHVIARQS